MRLLEGGTFRMGSGRFYPEEAPVRSVRLSPFWIDEVPVTNCDIREFTDATGHVTEAERGSGGWGPGSLVFRRTAGPVPLDDPRHWWSFEEGASWRRPTGLASNLERL